MSAASLRIKNCAALKVVVCSLRIVAEEMLRACPEMTRIEVSPHPCRAFPPCGRWLTRGGFET